MSRSSVFVFRLDGRVVLFQRLVESDGNKAVAQMLQRDRPE